MAAINEIDVKKFLKDLQIDCTFDMEKLNKFEYYLKHNYISLKEDHDGLSKCILKFIELIINYVSSKEDYQDQVLISKKYFGVIKDIIQDDLKNFFLKKFTKLIFDTMIEDDSKKTWCVKKELLKVFNCCIQNSNKAVKCEVVNQLPPIYLCKMVDNISSYGDYDLQVTVIETIFRMYGKSKITPRLRELIPESEELSESFAQINPDHFDDDCRSFLNMLNGKYEKIFSIVCEHIKIDDCCCIPAMADVGGIWVDFNLWDSALSWYQRASSDEDDDSWELISLFASNVEAVSTYSKPNEDSFIIKFTVSGGCLLTSVDEKQAELNDTKCVMMLVNKSDKASKLISDVLPKILGNRYENPMKSTIKYLSGIKSYKPLKIKFKKRPKSVISRAATDTSGTSLLHAISLASSTTGHSEERSVSGESQDCVDLINNTDDEEHLPEAAEKNCNATAKTPVLQILSGRCSDSFVNYSQFNRLQKDTTSQQENSFSQKGVTQNVIPVQSGRTLKNSKPQPNSSSENWHTAEERIVTYLNRDRTSDKSNSAVLQFSNKLNHTPEMTEDYDSLMVNIHQDDPSQKENRYSNCKASKMKMLKPRKTDSENLTSVTDVKKTRRLIDKKITTNKTTTDISRNIETFMNFEEQIILTNDVIPETQNLRQEPNSQYFSQSSQYFSIAEGSGFVHSFADHPSPEMENTDFFSELSEGSPQESLNISLIKGKHQDITRIANSATKQIQTNTKNIKASKFSMEPKTVSNIKPSGVLKETITTSSVPKDIKASKFSMEPKTVSDIKPGFLKETKTVSNIKPSGVLKETMKTSKVPKDSKTKDKVKETTKEYSSNEKGISAADDATNDKDKVTKLDYPTNQQRKGKQRRQKQIKKLSKDESRDNEVLLDEETREEYAEIPAKNSKKKKAVRKVKSVEKIKQLQLVSEFSKAEPETHHESISLLEGAEVPRIVKTTQVDTHVNKNEVIKPDNITETIDVEVNISQEEAIYEAHTDINKADLEHFVVTASDVDGTKKINKTETVRQKNATDETTSSRRYRTRKAIKEKNIVDLDKLENKNDANLNNKNAKKKQTKQILEKTDKLVKSKDVKRRLNVKMATRGQTRLETIALASDNRFNEAIGIDLEQDQNKSGVSEEIIGGKPASITSDVDVEDVWHEIESNENDEVAAKERDTTLKVCDPQHSDSPERDEIENTLHKTLDENPIMIGELSDTQDQTSPTKNTIDQEIKEILFKGVESDEICMTENEVQKSYTVQELREELTSTSSEGDKIANTPPLTREKESAIEITDNRIECNEDSSEDEIKIPNLKRYRKSKISRTFMTSSSEEEPERPAAKVAEEDINTEKCEAFIVDPEKAFDLLKKTLSEIPDVIRESKEIKTIRELVICLNDNYKDKEHISSYVSDDPETIHLSQLSEGQIRNVITKNRNMGFELNETLHENVIINAVKTDEIIKENIEDVVNLSENVTEVAVTKTGIFDETKRSIKLTGNSKSKENEGPLKKSLKRKVTKADSGKNTKIKIDKNKLTNNIIKKVVKKNVPPKKHTENKIRDVKIEEKTELRRAEINAKVADESSHEVLSEKVPLKTNLKAKISNTESSEKTKIKKTKGKVIGEKVPPKKYKLNKISDVKLAEETKFKKTVNNSDIAGERTDELFSEKLSLKAPQKDKIRNIESIEKTKIDNINIDTEEIELISDNIDEVVNGKKKTVQFELNKTEANSNSIIEQTKDLNQTFSTTVSSRRRRKLYCPDDISVMQYAPEENALDSARATRKTVELQEADKMSELQECSKHDESVVTKRNVRQILQPKSSVDGKLAKSTTVLDENNNSGKTKTSKSPAYKKVDSRKRQKYTVRYDDIIQTDELFKKKSQRYVKLNKTIGSNGNRDDHFKDYIGHMLNSFRQDLNSGESLLNTLNNYKEKTPTKKRISEKNAKVTIVKNTNTTKRSAEKRVHIISDIHLDHLWNKLPPPPPKKPKLQVNQQAEENIVNGFEGDFLKETAENIEFNLEQADIPDGCNALIGKLAPHWTATAVFGDEFATIDSDDYIGQFLVLFFYPFDFGKLPYTHPPTEIVCFNENLEQFEQLSTNIVCCSVDSFFTHQELIEKLRANKSLEQLKIPLISDASQEICKAYQMLVKNSGHSYRGAFIINPSGFVVGYTMMDLTVPIRINHIIEYIKTYKEINKC